METKELKPAEKAIRLSKAGWIISIALKWCAWAAALASAVVGAYIALNSGWKDGAYLIMSAPTILLGSFIMLMLERILKDVKDGGTPFTQKNADRIRIIARLFLIIVVWGTGCEFSFPPTTTFSDPETGYMSVSRTEINPVALFYCFIVYILAFLFEYGVKLQQQADETL